MKKYLTDSHQTHKIFWLRLLGWIMVAMLIVMSLISLPNTDIPIPNSDKWLHLITYFAVSYWFFHVYVKKTMYTVIGFTLLGVALELLQSLTPFRFFEWLDMVMNITGVLLAWVIFGLLKFRISYIAG